MPIKRRNLLTRIKTPQTKLFDERISRSKQKILERNQEKSEDISQDDGKKDLGSKLPEKLSVSSTTALHDFPISRRKILHDDPFYTNDSVITSSSNATTLFDEKREIFSDDNETSLNNDDDLFDDFDPNKLFSELTLDEMGGVSETKSFDLYCLENHSDDETMYLLHEYYRKLKEYETGKKYKNNNKTQYNSKKRATLPLRNNIEKKALIKNELAKLSKRYSQMEQSNKTRNFSEDSRANDFLEEISSKDLQDNYSGKRVAPKKSMNFLNPINEKKRKERPQDQKIKDLKGHHKKVVQACFQDNLKNNRSSIYWTCPFDPSHRVQAKIYRKHVFNCRDYLAPKTEILECPYNSNHLLLKDNYSEHVRRCVDQTPYMLQGSANGLSKIAVEVQ